MFVLIAIRVSWSELRSKIKADFAGYGSRRTDCFRATSSDSHSGCLEQEVRQDQMGEGEGADLF